MCKLHPGRCCAMKHCGKEHCEGQWCQNWQKCRGETIPPWTLFQFKPSTAACAVREQDVLAAADALAEKVLAVQAAECLSCVTSKDSTMDCTDCPWNTVGILASNYQRNREGKR